MDFVVVGFGLGAMGVLCGVIVLSWLAERWERAAPRAPSSDHAAHDLAVAASRRAAGRVFIYAGGAVLLATVGGLAGSLDDRTGAFLVTTTATVAVLGIFLWGHLHHARTPTPPLPNRRARAVPVTGIGEVAASTIAVPLSFADDVPFSAPAIPDGDGAVLANDATADDATTWQDDSLTDFVSLVPSGEAESAEPGVVDDLAGNNGDRVTGDDPSSPAPPAARVPGLSSREEGARSPSPGSTSGAPSGQRLG